MKLQNSVERGHTKLKERLEKYALLAEIIGALAIVASLIFVGVQVRQSNSLAATDALKDGTELWTDALVTNFGTEESVSFFIKAINRCEDLSMEQRGRFHASFAKLVSAYDNIYNQHEAGRLREEVFVSIASWYYALAQSPCGRDLLTKDFVSLPPWLISPDGIDGLSNLDSDMKLPRFLIE